MHSRFRGRRVTASIVAFLFLASLLVTPVTASAIIDRPLGETAEVFPGSVEGVERVVTAGGWYDATDPADDSEVPALRLRNIDTGAAIDLPAGSEQMLFDDAWLVWSQVAGDDYVVYQRALGTGEITTLRGGFPAEAMLQGDRLIGVGTDPETGESALTALDLATGLSASVPLQLGFWSNGLTLDGDVAVWAEAADGSEETLPTLWNIKAWDMAAGGESVDVASEVVLRFDGTIPELEVAAGNAIWTQNDGIHLFDLGLMEERVVAQHPTSLSASDGWIVWTAAGVSGQGDVFAMDVASGDEPVNITHTSVSESRPSVSEGWAVFHTPDALLDRNTIMAVDLDTGQVIPVSDPADPSAALVGLDGARVTWLGFDGKDAEGADLLALKTRVLGLPAPVLLPRYYGSDSECQVTWPAVTAAEAYEYSIDGGEVVRTETPSFLVTGLGEGASVTVRVRSVIGEEVSSSWSEAEAMIAPVSRLTLRASAGTIAERARVSLSGDLTSGVRRVDGRVRLQVSTDGATWTDLPGAVTTSTAGTFSFQTSPARTLRYRAVFDGDDSHAGAVSPVVVVTMRGAIGSPSFLSKSRRNRTYTVSGRVGPDLVAHPSTSVTVYAYHREGSRWVLRLRAAARTSFNGTTSRFSAPVKLTRTGKWRMRAVYKGNSLATGATSAWRYTTVI